MINNMINPYWNQSQRDLSGGGGQRPINGPGGQNPAGGFGRTPITPRISGPGGTMPPTPNPNPGLPKPFPSAPPPGVSYPGGMGQGQPQPYQQPFQINPAQGYGPQTGLQQRFGQQQGYPASQATSNPYAPQFRQPAPQPQQMPANPYNPYQNDWNWNQSGQFPGGRFPAY
jgi:hypothetical protein